MPKRRKKKSSKHSKKIKQAKDLRQAARKEKLKKATPKKEIKKLPLEDQLPEVIEVTLNKQDTQKIKQLNAKIRSSIIKDRRKEAGEQYQQIIDIYKKNNINSDHSKYGAELDTAEYKKLYYSNSVEELVSLARQSKDTKEEIHYARALLIVHQKYNDKLQHANTLLNIGAIQSELGKHKEAIEYYSEAKDLYIKFGNQEDKIVFVVSNTGQSQSELGKHKEAMESYKEAIKLHTKSGDKEGLAKVLYNIGVSQRELKNYKEAIKSYREAAKLYIESDNKEDRAETLNSIGASQADLGNHREAIESYTESKELYTKSGNNKNLARALHNIGKSQAELGKYKEAMESYKEAIKLYAESGDKKNHAGTLHNIGESQGKLGKHKEAIESYKKAIKLYAESGDKEGSAIALHNIGVSQAKLGKHKEAIESYKEAMKQYTKFDNKEGQANNLNNIGSSQIKLGNYKEAKKYLEDGVKLSHETSIHANTSIYLNLAYCCNMLEENKRSLEYLKKAKKLNEMLKPEDKCPNIDFYISHVSAADNNPDVALKSLPKKIAIPKTEADEAANEEIEKVTLLLKIMKKGLTLDKQKESSNEPLSHKSYDTSEERKDSSKHERKSEHKVPQIQPNESEPNNITLEELLLMRSEQVLERAESNHITPRMLNLYFKYTKSQFPKHLIKLSIDEQSQPFTPSLQKNNKAAWVVGKKKFDETQEKVIKLDGKTDFFGVISDKVQLDTLTQDKFSQALKHGMVKHKHKSNGVKYCGGVIELKIKADQRLYAKEIQKNPDGKYLIIFDYFAKDHNALKKIAQKNHLKTIEVKKYIVSEVVFDISKDVNSPGIVQHFLGNKEEKSDGDESDTPIVGDYSVFDSHF